MDFIVEAKGILGVVTEALGLGVGDWRNAPCERRCARRGRARGTGAAASVLCATRGEGEGRRTMELARHAAQQLSELTIRGAGKLGANLYVQPEATVF